MKEQPHGHQRPKTTGNEANVEVGKDGAHDRVAMLSLKADGTPRPARPEIIGDKDSAVEATQRQFAEQAVSAVDEAARRDAGLGAVEKVEQDPTVAKVKAEHDEVAAAAEKKAAAVVEQLHKV